VDCERGKNATIAGKGRMVTGGTREINRRCGKRGKNVTELSAENLSLDNQITIVLSFVSDHQNDSISI